MSGASRCWEKVGREEKKAKTQASYVYCQYTSGKIEIEDI